jgi:hypothetical protein
MGLLILQPTSAEVKHTEQDMTGQPGSGLLRFTQDIQEEPKETQNTKQCKHVGLIGKQG